MTPWTYSAHCLAESLAKLRRTNCIDNHNPLALMGRLISPLASGSRAWDQVSRLSAISRVSTATARS